MKVAFHEITALGYFKCLNLAFFISFSFIYVDIFLFILFSQVIMTVHLSILMISWVHSKGHGVPPTNNFHLFKQC